MKKQGLPSDLNTNELKRPIGQLYRDSLTFSFRLRLVSAGRRTARPRISDTSTAPQRL